MHIAAFFKAYFGGCGVTGGAHRLFSHKSYKAKFGLRLFLVVMQTVSGQVSTKATSVRNSSNIWKRIP